MARNRPIRRWAGIGGATLVAALMVAVGAGGLAAQEAGEQLIVGVYVSPPFVIEQDGRYTGMAIELWEAVAGNLHLDYRYEKVPTLRELVEATASGRVDAAVTNLTITQQRAERIDFSQPWYDAGQRILISEEPRMGVRAVFAGLRELGYLRAYGWIAFVIVVATIVLTLFDRRFDRDFPRRWRDGIAESFYTVMSIAMLGKAARKNLFGWVGRIWSALWLVCGVAILAYVTSTVTSVMTTLALTSQINSLADLPGKTVGVLAGSVSEDFVRKSAIASRPYENVDMAVAGLMAADVAAIVGDAPVLEYFAYTHPELRVAVVGPIFEPDKYGFALRRDSGLTRPVTLQVLGAYESGLLDELRIKYFGDDL